MVKITYTDFLKVVKLLEKESQGGILTIREDGAMLKIDTPDKVGKYMTIEISDTAYPFQPRITKTETF
jgi:hypothetical protein